MEHVHQNSSFGQFFYFGKLPFRNCRLGSGRYAATSLERNLGLGGIGANRWTVRHPHKSKALDAERYKTGDSVVGIHGWSPHFSEVFAGNLVNVIVDSCPQQLKIKGLDLLWAD